MKKLWVPLAILVLPTAMLVHLSRQPGPVPKKVAPPAPVAAQETREPAPNGGAVSWATWPRGASTVPAEASLALPKGTVVLDTALDPNGAGLFVIFEAGHASSLARWDFARALDEVKVDVEGRVTEIASSGFDDTVYLLVDAGREYAIARARAALGAAELSNEEVIYRSPERLSDLTCPYVTWDGDERCFFARALTRTSTSTQVIAVKRSGALPYEVTSPTGTLGPRTADELRRREEPERPAVQRLSSARPISLDPDLGTLHVVDGGGRVLAIGYEDYNWSPPRPLAGRGEAGELARGTVVTHTPNAWLTLRWSPDARGIALDAPVGVASTREAEDLRFLRPPEVLRSGRAIAGVAEHLDGPTVLVTRLLHHPLAPVRFLGRTAKETVAALAEKGIEVRPTRHAQIYQEYERLLYDPPRPVPVFASIDGMIEILNAGFQAAFMLAEREVSRPRLEAFAAALGRASSKHQLSRVAAIAEATTRMLHGDYAHPEGKLVLAEQPAPSSLHTVPAAKAIDFRAFHPRGSYTTSPELTDYFRAFHYLNQLVLTTAERSALTSEPQLIAAYDAWVDVQAAFVWPSRQFERSLRAPPTVAELSARRVHPEAGEGRTSDAVSARLRPRRRDLGGYRPAPRRRARLHHADGGALPQAPRWSRPPRRARERRGRAPRCAGVCRSPGARARPHLAPALRGADERRGL